MRHCNQVESLVIQSQTIAHNKKKTMWVLWLSLVMMAVEIAAGYLTESMALLADGWHMASHVGALGITYIAYALTQSKKLRHSLNFGTGKLLPLGGYTSALVLGIVALLMAYESVERMFHPAPILYHEALWIAVIGLAVNLASALILGGAHEHDDGHDHARGEPPGHHDHNHASAVAHVLADALTSVMAIAALLIGSRYGITWVDSATGLLGAFMILRWAVSLSKEAAWELLDPPAESIDTHRLSLLIESAGGRVTDLHFWKVGPAHVVGQLVVESRELRGADYYRSALSGELSVQHLVIEERKIT